MHYENVLDYFLQMSKHLQMSIKKMYWKSINLIKVQRIDKCADNV